MNRFAALAALALLCLALSYLASCSNPLDVSSASPSGGQQPVDTTVRVDTVRITDTVRLIDTSHSTDTMIRVDTIRTIDTHTVVDTMRLVDTVKVTKTIVDTVIRRDTIVRHDTVTHWDTLTHYDTLRVIQPGDCNPLNVCGKISCGDKDILWVLRNDHDSYHLELTAYSCCAKPIPCLLVKINGTTYKWNAGSNPSWIKDLTLNSNSKMIVTLEDSRSYNCDIDVCLKISKN